MLAPLTANACITCDATLNAIACMCQAICDVTSSNVLGRLVQCEQKAHTYMYAIILWSNFRVIS